MFKPFQSSETSALRVEFYVISAGIHAEGKRFV